MVVAVGMQVRIPARRIDQHTAPATALAKSFIARLVDDR
jgi:hypothetical protein